MKTVDTNRAEASPGLIQGDRAAFVERFNQQPFAFEHRLTDHPLLQLPRVAQLVQSLPRGNFYFDAGDIAIGQRWDQSPRGQWPVEELVERIENAQAFIIVKRVQDDPEYAALLDECLMAVEQLAQIDLRPVMRSKEGIIFVTSPNRVTAYHIDRECNFLVQLRGSKHISIFDRNDQEVLPEVERERFWTVDNNAAVYKPDLQNRASVFEMKPGTGVHIPVNAPHWVQNGNNVSITFAITFQFHDHVLADVYRTNYYLRKMGLAPVPPGRSKLRDSLKSTAFRCARRVRHVLRPERDASKKAHKA